MNIIKTNLLVRCHSKCKTRILHIRFSIYFNESRVNLADAYYCPVCMKYLSSYSYENPCGRRIKMKHFLFEYLNKIIYYISKENFI